jgi:DNA-binding NarL/FixJ family response regulator
MPESDRSLPPIRGRTASDMADGRPAMNMPHQSLTRREAEVAGLVSKGLPNKVVARQLGVVEGTVKIHLNNIYRKLQVTNRVGLILSAISSHRQAS